MYGFTFAAVSETFSVVLAMLAPSFPSPRRVGVFLLSAVILAGCGGTRETRPSKVVSGRGFAVSVPVGWEVKRAPGQISADKGDEPVSVRAVALTKPYRPELPAGAAKELDRVAAEVARGLHGEISTTCRRCPEARRDVLARGYVLRYGDLLQEITFVLV